MKALLSFTKHRIAAHMAEESSSWAIDSLDSSSRDTKPNPDMSSTAIIHLLVTEAEVARLRAENAILRAQISTIPAETLVYANATHSTPLNNALFDLASDANLAENDDRRHLAQIQPASIPSSQDDWTFENAAPTYEEALISASTVDTVAATSGCNGADEGVTNALTAYMAVMGINPHSRRQLQSRQP